MEITPRQNVYNPGDNITCEAFGNPPPSYQWVDHADPDSPLLDSVLEVKLTENRQQTWTCHAQNYNYLEGRTHNISETISFEVGKCKAMGGHDLPSADPLQFIDHCG